MDNIFDVIHIARAQEGFNSKGNIIDISYRFPRKVKISKKSLEITNRKCVQERKIHPNPTHDTKFDKYTEIRKRNPDWFELGNYRLPIDVPERHRCD